MSARAIGQISYYTPLLGSKKERTRSTQKLDNSGLYWKNFPMGIVRYILSKSVTFFFFFF